MEDRLEALRRYTRLIPFDGYQDKSWDSFWFSGQHTPETLARLAENPQPDGTLAPHQTFLLVLMQLLETPKQLLNTLPYRHRDLYYRGLLGLQPQEAVADRTVLSITLAEDARSLLLPAGCAFDAGQDSEGNALRYQLDASLLAGRQRLNQLCWSRLDPQTKKPLLCHALDSEAGLTLPADGLRLFQATQKEETLPAELTTEAAAQQLFVGFTVGAGETLSLWWSLATPVQQRFNWFYRSTTQAWQPLDAWLEDRTDGLYRSGLWQAVLPADIAAGAPGLADEQWWLKAVPVNPLEGGDCPTITALFANAMTATLDTRGPVAADHFDQPLAAGTISQPEQPLDELEGVEQPLASHGGAQAETEQQFFQRAAQRLSHRNRAVTWNDYRQLLMERYPQVMDVKSPAVSRLSQVPAPLTQQMVIVPHIQQRDNDDALRPTLHAARLTEMTETLSALASPFVTLKLSNPTYINVQAHFRVAFAPGVNPDYGYQQLVQRLEQRFMPWGGDGREGVRPGNRIDFFQVQAALQQSALVSRVLSLTLKRDDSRTDGASAASFTAGEHEVLILRCTPTLTEGNPDE